LEGGPVIAKVLLSAKKVLRTFADRAFRDLVVEDFKICFLKNLPFLFAEH